MRGLLLNDGLASMISATLLLFLLESLLKKKKLKDAELPALAS